MNNLKPITVMGEPKETRCLSSEPTPGIIVTKVQGGVGPKIVLRPRGSECGSLIVLKLWTLNHL